MAENQGERQWIVEPPGVGEISLHMAFGDGVQLTKEQEAALGQLISSLEAVDAEVTGHAKPDPCTSNCVKLQCNNLNSCSGLKCGTLGTKVAAGGGFGLMGTFGTGIA